MKNKLSVWFAVLFVFFSGARLLEAQFLPPLVLDVSSSPAKVSGVPLPSTVTAGTILFYSKATGQIPPGAKLQITFDAPIDSLITAYPLYNNFDFPCNPPDISFSGSELVLEFNSGFCSLNPGSRFWISGVNLRLTGNSRAGSVIGAMVSREVQVPPGAPVYDISPITFSPATVPVVDLQRQ